MHRLPMKRCVDHRAAEGSARDGRPLAGVQAISHGAGTKQTAVHVRAFAGGWRDAAGC